MSLIHEALKKAEQQRRLGTPPDLGTPFTAARRQRSLLPYLAAAIVLTLGAGWWLSREAAPGNDDPAAAAAAAATAARDADKPTAPAAPAATPAAPPAGGAPVASSSAAERKPVMGASAVANTNVADSVIPPPRLNNQAPNPASNPPTVKDVAERESEPHPPGANPLAPGEAAPLALGAAPPPTPMDDPAGLAQKQATKEREHAGRTLVGADPAARSPRKPPQSEAAAVAEANRPPPPKPAAEAPPKAPPSLPPPVAAPPVAAAAAPPAPPLEQLPVHWQLPYNVRKELPELKLSMHVYSVTPGQRFVVLNGNRQVEGDEIGGDVHVAEIRTDGVVLTYHGQRFLIPRGGS